MTECSNPKTKRTLRDDAFVVQGCRGKNFVAHFFCGKKKRLAIFLLTLHDEYFFFRRENYFARQSSPLCKVALILHDKAIFLLRKTHLRDGFCFVAQTSVAQIVFPTSDERDRPMAYFN